MNKKLIYFVLCLFAVTSLACNQKNNTENETNNQTTSDKIVVYYFHYTQRCATCNAVENVTKETLNEYFADEMKSEKIVFKSANLDKESGKKRAEELKVSGQTLLFVRGDKKVNLTNQGFLYAKNSPDKLKTEIKKTVNNLKTP